MIADFSFLVIAKDRILTLLKQLLDHTRLSLENNKHSQTKVQSFTNGIYSVLKALGTVRRGDSTYVLLRFCMASSVDEYFFFLVPKWRLLMGKFATVIYVCL